MSQDDKVGYASPPKSTQWKPGQSGNPKGRPKSKTEILQDSANILIQPVEARTPDGKTVRLDGIEAAFLSLCKNGLKGHKPSLFAAIAILLDVGPAVEAAEQEEEAARQEVIELLERMGVKIDPM